MCLGLQLGTTHSLQKTQRQIVSVRMLSLSLVSENKKIQSNKEQNPNTWDEQLTFVLVFSCKFQGMSAATSSGAVE